MLRHSSQVLCICANTISPQGLLAEALSSEFTVTTVSNLTSAQECILNTRFDLILITQTGQSGECLKACSFFRKEPATSHIPLLVLSQGNSLSDRLLPFQAGADDVVCAPFEPAEITMRIRSKISRFSEFVRERKSKKSITFGNLTLDSSNHLVKIKNQTLPLTPVEFQILFKLVSAPNHVASRTELEELIWKGKPAEDRALDCHMMNLRKKLKAFDHRIVTLYGRGFTLSPLQPLAERGKGKT